MPVLGQVLQMPTLVLDPAHQTQMPVLGRVLQMPTLVLDPAHQTQMPVLGQARQIQMPARVPGQVCRLKGLNQKASRLRANLNPEGKTDAAQVSGIAINTKTTKI
jgi:hypothetical protein